MNPFHQMIALVKIIHKHIISYKLMKLCNIKGIRNIIIPSHLMVPLEHLQIIIKV